MTVWRLDALIVNFDYRVGLVDLCDGQFINTGGTT